MTRYRTVVADPPWDIRRPAGGTWTGGQGGNRPQPYPTMDDASIKRLGVESLVGDRAHLYLWTVNGKVDTAYEVARAWGFTPAALITWCKAPMGAGPGGLFSITSEFVLFARRGPEPRRMVVHTTWFQWPRGAQSVKPDAFYDLVESVSPGPFIDLFARRQRLGWDVWGNEVDSAPAVLAVLPLAHPEPQNRQGGEQQ